MELLKFKRRNFYKEMYGMQHSAGFMCPQKLHAMCVPLFSTQVNNNSTIGPTGINTCAAKLNQ